MKKIFTFLFFAGLVTGVMAQNGRSAQYRNQGNGQPGAYANNGQVYTQPTQSAGNYGRGGNGYNQNNGYSGNERSYGSNHENGYNADRRFDERNDDRRFREHERFDKRFYGYENRREFEHANHGRFNAGISIRFRQPVCF